MSNNPAIRVLMIQLLLITSASSFITTKASSTIHYASAIRAPPPAHAAEGAKVTAAPDLKRQESVSANQCTDQWSYFNGAYPVGCTAPNTCLFKSVSGFGVAYCGMPGSTYYISTACSGYSVVSTGPPYDTVRCAPPFPYCNTIKFIADSFDTYTMFGCESWQPSTSSIAYAIAGAVITTQSDGPLTIPVQSTTTNGEYSPSSTSSKAASQSPAPASSVPSGVNTAGAIGGALGGFASVVVALLAVWRFWVKHKKEKEPINP